MAEISLRQYVQQIDDIIEDSDQLEEAIAHCRHILKSFPKHIDTYRLLGKAYLESKRYGDAADIFQRVLSAIPDDFVSHVGMAIIREDEGNLDAAIWHMERSSESKPGNAAIEQELKRLIGKRDGLEPQRVRPTRGALARMYSHGELYSYATTELRKALSEDPDRPDLQVLLANTYWRTDQRLDAARLCSLILEKLPHCRDANRITAALLIENGKTEEAKSNLRRLISLDPYFAYLKNPMDDPLSVETSSILIERLTWTGGLESVTDVADQPDWVASLSSKLEEDNSTSELDEDMPEWLRAESQPNSDAADAEPVESPTIHPFEGASPPAGGDMPEWMQEAGWGDEASSETDDASDQDQSSALVSEDSSEDSEGIAAAEFPDWLSEITSTDQETPQVPSVEPVKPASGPAQDLVEDRNSSEIEESTPEDFNFESYQSENDDGESEIPENDGGIEPNMRMSENFINDASEDEGQDEFSSESQDQSATIADDTTKAGTQELPPWLESSTPGATDTIVTWLGDKSGDGPSAPSDDIPTWMRGTGPLIVSAPAEPPQQVEQSPTAAPAGEERDSSIDFRAQQVARSANILSTDDAQEAEEPAESDPAPPVWLEELGEQPESVASIQNIEPTPDFIEDLPTEEDQSIESTEAVEEAAEYSSPAEISEPELQVGNTPEEPPDWLKGVIGKDGEEESPAADVQPEWLQGVTDNASEQEIAGQEIPQDSPEWLTESIAEQVADSPPDEVQPEWLTTLSESSKAESQASAAAEDSGPQWLTEMQVPDNSVDKEVGSKASQAEDVLEEIPLREAIESIVEEPIEEATIRRSEDESNEQQMQPTIEGPRTEEIAPDWLQDLSAIELTEGDVEQESKQVVEDEDWLQKIEADEIESTSEIPDLQVSGPGTFQEITPDQDEVVSQEPERSDIDTQEDELYSKSEAEREIENRLEWLQESAQEVAPEPELSVEKEDEPSAEDSAEAVADSLEKPMGEDEVYGFLEGLASKHEVEIEEIPIIKEEPEAKIDDVDREIKTAPSEAQAESQDEPAEDYEAGLEWLEQLATEDEYEEVIAPDFQSESEEMEASDVPDWLEEVAEQSNQDDLETEQPDHAPSSEDPSILDTIVAKKSDMVIDPLSDEIPPQEKEKDFLEIELGPSASAEEVDSPIEEVSASLPEESPTKMEAAPLDLAQDETFEAPEDDLNETSTEGQLTIARFSLQDGDLDRALEFYTRLIDQKEVIDVVIADLITAVNNTPMSPTLWQALGDAYMQDGQITEAISAYRKGMEAV